jgi:hypothetical protein
MELKPNNYIEIVISACSFILFILFFFSIRKNSENIFFSMRSSNLMQITNLSIFMSILLYSLSDILYDILEENNVSFILTLYFVFQLIIFMSLILRYHRLYISCKINSLGKDDLLQFKFFEAKSYHYEYFYVRFMFVFILITLISSELFFFLSGKNKIMYNYELLNEKKDNVGNEIEEVPKENYLFWIILSFIETFIFLTYAFLIVKTHLSPKVNISKEIILVAFVNYFYFLSIGLSFTNYDFINNNILIFIPLLYNLLLYFVSIGLPFLWGRFNETVINYDLPGELASSLYLFLTKERCFDLFHNYLYKNCIEREKGIFYLDMLINIFKYRLLIFNNQDHLLIVQEMNKIEREYLGNNRNYFDPNLVNQMKNACIENRETPKINVFDPITNVIYDYLDGEFQKYIKTEEFDSLKNELMQETYVRCKLANYGLIRN